MKLLPRKLPGESSKKILTGSLRVRRKKPYSKKCCVPGCKGRAPVQRVFKFPSNSRTGRLWRIACGFTPYSDSTNKRVCEKHFCKELLQGKYLPKQTVPTLNLPKDEVEDVSDGSGDVSGDVTGEENEADNSYSSEQELTDYKLDLFDDVDPTEIETYKSFGTTVKRVIERKSHCTTCDIHIGTAPINEAIIKMHPLLRVTLCKKCFTFYNTGGFECGEDGSELYCRWCGQGGELYCCSNCPYVFCENCITLNFPKKMVTDIQNIEHWKCFACNPSTIIMTLRADHWALMNFIEQQKLDILNTTTDEIEINHRMSKDVSKCCNDQMKRLVNKRKPDNTADIPAVPEPKRQAIDVDALIDLEPEDAEPIISLETATILIEPEPTSAARMVLSPPRPVSTSPRPVSTSPRPVSTPPRPVATVRPTGSSDKKLAPPPPPKILNNLLAKKAEAKNQSQANSSNASKSSTQLQIGTPTIRILPNPTQVPALVPAGLTLTPTTSVSNFGIQRPPNPVYHTVNGFCIDLNSAAQQDMYRLPNGKIIQVRRQQAASQPQPGAQIVPPQIQTQPQLQMLQPAFQSPQFIQQLQSMGATIVQQLVPQQTQVNQVNVVNKIPPLMLRPVHGNLSVESSHVQLNHHVSNTVQVYQHMNTKIKTFTNSSAYKSVNSLTDIKDLTVHLTYLLNYSIGRLQSIRKECASSMKIIETEIGKQNKIDGDECEIVETNVAPVINLDSDDEELPNNGVNINNTINTSVKEFVDISMPSQSTRITPVVHQPPIPQINIRNKIVPPSKGKLKTPTNQQNIIAKFSKLADKGGSGDIVIRKIKTEPKSFMTKTGTKLVKVFK